MYRGQSGLELKYSKNWILRRKSDDHKTIWFVSQYQDISIDIMSASYTIVIWLSLDNNWFYIYGGSILFLGQLSWEFSQAGKKGPWNWNQKLWLETKHIPFSLLLNFDLRNLNLLNFDLRNLNFDLRNQRLEVRDLCQVYVCFKYEF